MCEYPGNPKGDIMTQGQMISLAMQAIRVVILASAPPLLIGLAVGLIVSIFQTVTSIQDATLTFVPKIIAIFLSIAIFGPYMMNTVMEFMRGLFLNLHLYIR